MLDDLFIVSRRCLGYAVTFKLSWRFVSQTRMHACRVVPRGDFLRGVPIALDIGKHAMLRRRSGRKVLAMGLLDLQRMPETLHRRVMARGQASRS